MKRLMAMLALAATFVAASPAAADPLSGWCNPSSPLFDPTICWKGHGSTGGVACDPYNDSYNPNYCQATRGRKRGF
jgi:hypothetical protein